MSARWISVRQPVGTFEHTTDTFRQPFM